ncbi:MAG: hypothetical protein KM296_06585, partial [Brockia lithotrophica]|nr:hypothetical protein [Brockia lithotrophica]
LAKDLARREVLAQAHEGRVARALVLHREVGHDKVTLKLHIATVENIARPEPVSGSGDGPEAQPGA